jgi:hypothetical protein
MSGAAQIPVGEFSAIHHDFGVIAADRAGSSLFSITVSGITRWSY